MSWGHTVLIVFAALAPLGLSGVVPTLKTRDGVNNDIIRYMKCQNLYSIKPDVGGFEQGMAGYWKDVSSKNPPDQISTGDLYTRLEDYFVNGKGDKYGGDFEAGGGSVQMTITEPNFAVIPPTAVFVGSAIRNTSTTSTSYNCFTENFHNPFSFKHEKYRTCTSYVWCMQKDALRIYAKATEDVVTARDLSLPKPAEIYSRFNERYDAKTGVCDETKITLPNKGIGDSCSVKFECKNNDQQAGSAVMDTLITNLKQFGQKAAYSESQEPGLCVTMLNGPCVQDPKKYTYRTMPATTQLLARGQPPPNSGRYGYEVSYIKTTIDCKTRVMDKTLCTAIGGLFSVATLFPATAPIGVFGGAAMAVGCGLGGA